MYQTSRKLSITSASTLEENLSFRQFKKPCS
uniref:Uncharacterized protein n=1 Tax=Rhizophora mucronata TaxID=61149 RepID=A0A2P2QJ22_RHIMU